MPSACKEYFKVDAEDRSIAISLQHIGDIYFILKNYDEAINNFVIRVLGLLISAKHE